MERLVTPLRWGTSPTRGPPPPCEQALRLLRTYSSKTLFEENIKNFKSRLLERRNPEDFIRRTLSEVTFEDRNLELQQKRKEQKKIQSRSQGLSSSHPRKRERGGPGWVWSRVSQRKITPREGSFPC